MNNLQIYKASAGSGKTYLLTLSFLKLAFEAPMNFSKILAVTFTNKAADEMKTRIILELNEIIENKAEADYFSEIKKHLNNISDDEMVEKALDIRNNILHNYSQFFVSTIDSFVQRVIKAFAFEINLSANYAIELDQNAVVNELSDMLYMQISENAQLQKWLIQFASHKIDNSETWDFRKEISSLANEIFKEKFQNLKQFANTNESSSDELNEELNSFLKEIKTIYGSFEKRMNELADNAKIIIEKSGFDYTKQGAKFKTICNFFLVKIPAKKYDVYDTKSFTGALDGIENWQNKKTSSEVSNNIESVFNPLYKLVEQAFKLFDNEFPNYNTAKIILKNYYSFGILKDIAMLLPKYRTDNNVLLISDTTLLLKEIIGNNDAPFIYEKIGNRFKHILIDEFQDTSGFQWANFKPLIENSLSEAFFNLIVGDIKQSIYRWRGGDWKLLLSGVKAQINETQIEEKSLDTNWRSKKNIIDFNNSIFNIAPKILQEEYNLKLSTIKSPELLRSLKDQDYDKILTEAYKENYQKTPNKPEKAGGRVFIDFINQKGRNYDDYIETLDEKLPETINNLLTNSNYKPKDIAILCRTNRHAKAVVDILLKSQTNNHEREAYEIISSDSLLISGSSAVKIIIGAIKYLIQPENLIDYNSLKYEWFTRKNIAKDKLHKTFTDLEENILPQEFFERISELKRKSLFEISEDIISIFELSSNQEDFPYIKALQDIISDFTGNKTADIQSFIEWWDEKGKNASVQMSDEQDAVTIMTLHKSKGLAFKVVIMPFTDWKLTNTNNNTLLWAKSDIEPFNKFEYLPIINSENLAESVFVNDYFDEKLYSNMDALNMLYVAFTRAKDELIVFAPIKPDAKGNIKVDTVSHLLYHSILVSNTKIIENDKEFIPLKLYFNEDESFFESTDNYQKQKAESSSNETKTENTITLTSYPNFKWSEKLSLYSDSDDFYKESIEAVKEKVDYGSLMHKIFAEINTPDEVDFAIETIFHQGYITEEEKAELTEKITEIINRDNVKNWFKPGLKVINEEGIISEKGELKIPDRIIIDNDKITVIDFKFGIVRDEYISQIQEYKELVQSIFKKDAEALLYYAESDTVVYA